MVVAENQYQARDAADAVIVDYDTLPAVIDLKQAASDEVKVHDDLDSNIIHTWTYHGYWDALGLESQQPKIEEAKQRDDVVVVSQEMVNQRLIPVAIEPRSVVADWSGGYEQFTVTSSSQVPHALSGAISKTFGIAANAVRVIAPEVGGGIRSEAQRVCRRDPRLFRFAETRRCRQVDRDPARGCRLDHPRTGLGRNGDHRRDS